MLINLLAAIRVVHLLQSQKTYQGPPPPAFRLGCGALVASPLPMKQEQQLHLHRNCTREQGTGSELENQYTCSKAVHLQQLNQPGTACKGSSHPASWALRVLPQARRVSTPTNPSLAIHPREKVVGLRRRSVAKRVKTGGINRLASHRPCQRPRWPKPAPRRGRKSKRRGPAPSQQRRQGRAGTARST